MLADMQSQGACSSCWACYPSLTLVQGKDVSASPRSKQGLLQGLRGGMVESKLRQWSLDERRAPRCICCQDAGCGESRNRGAYNATPGLQAYTLTWAAWPAWRVPSGRSRTRGRAPPRVRDRVTQLLPAARARRWRGGGRRSSGGGGTPSCAALQGPGLELGIKRGSELG